MPVVINEVVTEVVIGAPPGEAPEAGAGGEPPGDDWIDLVVRRATEHVLEVLRREWER
jgi:Family of unknown function (DUF5908)